MISMEKTYTFTLEQLRKKGKMIYLSLYLRMMMNEMLVGTEEEKDIFEKDLEEILRILTRGQ